MRSSALLKPEAPAYAPWRDRAVPRSAPIARDAQPARGQGYHPSGGCRLFGIGGTLLLAVLTLGILLWAGHAPVTPATPAPRPAMTFALAPLPAAPPAPPLQVPPGPEAHEQDASALAEPPRETRPVETVVPTPLSPPMTASATAAPSAAAQANARTTAPPAASATAATVAARVSTASAGQAALVNWQSALLGHLKRFLRFPRQAERSGQQGVVLVALTVDRQGNVLAARIERGSGYPPLDGEALATVRRGSPVPPPTADIAGDPVSVVIPIHFSLRRR